MVLPWLLLDPPCVVPLLYCCTARTCLQYAAFEDNDKVYLLQEYAEGVRSLAAWCWGLGQKTPSITAAHCSDARTTHIAGLHQAQTVLRGKEPSHIGLWKQPLCQPFGVLGNNPTMP